MKTLGTWHPTDIPVFPDAISNIVLAAGTGQAIDVPSGAGFGVFSFNTDVWVRYGSTAAAVPSSSTTASSTNQELNPLARNFGSTQTCTGISIVSPTSGYGSISWYAP